jgi:NADPH:quinone reductase-like Zn-dependent oxidoreductase
VTHESCERSADVAIGDHRTRDPAIAHTTSETLDKSLRVLKPGGTVISITGPPDPTFAREIGANPVVRLAMAALSYRIRRRARRHQVTYSYLFMKASGDQLRELAALIDAEIIRPVVDSVFDFGQTCEALAPSSKDAPRPARSSST